VKIVVRSVTRIASALTVSLFLYFVVVAVSYRASWSHDSNSSADVIVVMGAAQYDGVPSNLLEARLQHGLDLWKDGHAPLIALTGGKQSGDRFTEAAAGRRWLVDRGVPANAIVSEDVGQSTWQSLSQLAPVLREKNVETAIVVSSYWHVQRAELILRQLDFAAVASPVSGDSDSLTWNTKATGELLGISFGRLMGFDTLYSITG
jgi:uncharacterized SAM-binding protein YcdF (DUF218 family)